MLQITPKLSTKNKHLLSHSLRVRELTCRVMGASGSECLTSFQSKCHLWHHDLQAPLGVGLLLLRIRLLAGPRCPRVYASVSSFHKGSLGQVRERGHLRWKPANLKSDFPSPLCILLSRSESLNPSYGQGKGNAQGHEHELGGGNHWGFF